MRQISRRLRGLAIADEHHVWYVLDLDRVERLPLADGYELRLAGDADIDLVAASRPRAEGGATGGEGAWWAEMARGRHSEGVQMWLVTQGADPAFSCWIYPHEQPDVAGGDLELPPGVALLEDSYTHATHRGRGIAGAAWTAIAQELARDGYKVLITKVEVDNVPSRRAVEKGGFRTASVMHFRRRGPRERVLFEPGADDLTPAERETAEQLERTLTR